MFQSSYKDRKTGERRKAKTWAIQFYDRRLGQHQTEFGFKTEPAAEKALRQRLADLDAGRLTGPSVERTTFKDLAELVENDYIVNRRRSLLRLGQSLVHLRKAFGEMRAIQITEARVLKYQKTRLAEGAAEATVNREMAALKRAFRLGARAMVVGRVPHIPMLREDNIRKGFIEETSFRSILRHLPEDLRPVLQVAYVTGWRVQSEILTRQWRHVDLKNGWLRLEPGEAKNKQGRNWPLQGALAELFKQRRRVTKALERKRDKIIPWVFHRDGKPIHYLRRSWLTACLAAGVPGAILHDFRRTAVRNLERAAVPRSTAMALVGHKTESVYRRYAIVDERSLKEGVAMLGTPRRRTVKPSTR